jgi:hypothetical protein
MEEGDFLYLPRGTVHYATASDKGSVHITISTYQDHNYGTLLGRVLQDAVSEATKNHKNLRKNVPTTLLENFGEFTKGDETARAQLSSEMKELMPLLKPYFLKALDNVTDEYAVEFMSDRLPPKNITKQRMEEEDKDDQFEGPKVVDMKPLEDGKAVIETLVFGSKHVRVVNADVVPDDADIQFTMMDDDDSDGDEDTVDNKAESITVEKVNGAAGSKKKGKGKKEENEEEEDYYFLVDCGSSIIQTHMVDNFRAQSGSALTKFPKRMKPLVDRLFFSEYRLHQLSDLVKLGLELEDIKQELLNFYMRGLVKF